MDTTGVKDCELIFAGTNQTHKFGHADIATALKWAKDTDKPLLAIRTPWYTLSVMDSETYDTAMEAFKDAD